MLWLIAGIQFIETRLHMMDSMYVCMEIIHLMLFRSDGAPCALHYVQKRLSNLSLSSVCCRSQNWSYRISVMSGCLNSGYSTNSCCSAGVVLPLDLRCDRGRLLRRRRRQLPEIHPVVPKLPESYATWMGEWVTRSDSLTFCWCDCFEILWSPATFYLYVSL